MSAVGPGAAAGAAAGGFGARLRAAVGARGPLCVGIDPHAQLLTAWGVGDDVGGCERFAMTVVEALGERVAVFKPQSAFFERFGSAGVGVLERTVAAARQAGALVLLDVKRGDIGSTVRAYAQAYFDPASPLRADAVTASPYLGFGSLQPLLDLADATGNGVFVLALTSNPEGAGVQRAVGPDGRSVAGAVLDAAAARNQAQLRAGAVWGSTGVVVGATLSEVGHDLSGLHGPILAPGLGAQGAAPDRLGDLFGARARDVLPAMSRELLRHGPDTASLRAATDSAQDAVRAATGW